MAVITTKMKTRDLSPERTKVWAEPNKHKKKSSSAANDQKVAVVYYLSRNGQLEHPHFMEVPLSSPDGLYLTDVINHLNLLRGKGMASMYSWSSKRSYKNGFVWHDLTEHDLIQPSHNNEYILKGSEILEPLTRPLESVSFRAESPAESSRRPMRRRNQSWSSVDLNEYRVYKSDSVSESTRKLATDASTQTDDKRRSRVKPVKEELHKQQEVCIRTEMTREEIEEISPPPSDSSPETLESLMKADGRLILCSNNPTTSTNNEYATRSVDNKVKASTVLMQLLSCGSISFRDCGALAVRDQGLSLIGGHKGRAAIRDVGGNQGGKEVETRVEMEGLKGVTLEDKEYFSGSLIETNKKEVVPTLKRSSSYNADRSSQIQLAEKEIDGVRAKCIPRKPKALPTKKDGITVKSSESCANITSTSQHGSKRHELPQKVDIGAK